MERSTELAELSPDAPASLPVPTPGAWALPASPVSSLVQKKGGMVGAMMESERCGSAGSVSIEKRSNWNAKSDKSRCSIVLLGNE